jgi:hypothetical protein
MHGQEGIMYRGVIIYAPPEETLERLVRRLAGCFSPERFDMATTRAEQAAIPDLTRSDIFLLASLPSGGQAIHPDFSEILRALGGITLAGRVGGAFSVDSDETIRSFRKALQDCELELPEENFRNLSRRDLESPELDGWVENLTRQLEVHTGGR